MKNFPVILFLLVSAFTSSSVFSQRFVEGTVLADNNREAIPYAMIQIVEEGKLVYADEKGNFKLALSDEASTLLFTSTGFVKKEISIPAQAKKMALDVSMKATNSTAKGIAKGRKGKDKDNQPVVKQ